MGQHEVGRRGFLGGLLGICLAPFFPTMKRTVMTTTPPTTEWSAIKVVSDMVNKYVKGQGKFPLTIGVTSDIFDKYESELVSNQRFTNTNIAREGTRNLRFKCITLTRVPGVGHMTIDAKDYSHDLPDWLIKKS